MVENATQRAAAKYNFSPGPAAIPQAVHEAIYADLKPGAAQRAIPVLEMGHRTADFADIMERSQACLRELLDIPANYHILFLAGGARAQYAMAPMNLAQSGEADYFDTGYWSQCAMREAGRFARVHSVAEVGGSPRTLPSASEWSASSQAKYVHYVDNETLTGFELPTNFAESLTRHAPQWTTIVSDMTSNLLTRRIDVSRYGMIYAAAQKNIGIAGLTVVIIREDLCRPRETSAARPSLYDYATLAQSRSLHNTPPIFPWYVAARVLEWTRAEGGVQAMEERSERRARLLYDLVDRSAIYFNDVDAPFRSRVNVSFRVEPAELQERFLAQARNEGLYGLRGHTAVGGVRVSLYNAVSDDGVAVLADFMREFERNA